MPLDTTCWPELLLWRPHCHIQTKFHCKVFPAYLGSSPVQTTTDLRCLKSKINVRLLLYLSKTRYSYITKRKKRKKNPPTNRAFKKNPQNINAVSFCFVFVVCYLGGGGLLVFRLLFFFVFVFKIVPTDVDLTYLNICNVVLHVSVEIKNSPTPPLQ